MKRVCVLIVVCCVGLASRATHAAAATESEMALAGARWIAKQQRSNGAFFSDKTRADINAEAVGAMVAGGVTSGAVDDALAYIRRHGKTAATRGAFTGRIVAGLTAAGADPTDHGGVDYVKILRSQRTGGAFDDDQFFDNLLAANGALAAGESLDEAAIAYIRSNECSGGGFGFENECSTGADVDTSAWAISVLVAGGRKADPMVTRTRSYLVSQQHDDGGFGFTSAKPTGTDSTALVLSSLRALDESPAKAPWKRDGGDPVKALERLQTSSGGFRFVATSSPNAMSTVVAVPPLAGHAYPLPKGPSRPSATNGGEPGGDPAPKGDESDPDTGGAQAPATPSGSGSPTKTSTPGPRRSPGDVEEPDRRSASGDRDDDESFAAPQATEEGGPNRVLLGGLALVSLAGAGTGAWYLRFRR